WPLARAARGEGDRTLRAPGLQAAAAGLLRPRPPGWTGAAYAPPAGRGALVAPAIGGDRGHAAGCQGLRKQGAQPQRLPAADRCCYGWERVGASPSGPATCVSIPGTTSVLCADAHSQPSSPRRITKEKIVVRSPGLSTPATGDCPERRIRACTTATSAANGFIRTVETLSVDSLKIRSSP